MFSNRLRFNGVQRQTDAQTVDGFRCTDHPDAVRVSAGQIYGARDWVTHVLCPGIWSEWSGRCMSGTIHEMNRLKMYCGYIQ